MERRVANHSRPSSSSSSPGTMAEQQSSPQPPPPAADGKSPADPEDLAAFVRSIPSTDSSSVLCYPFSSHRLPFPFLVCWPSDLFLWIISWDGMTRQVQDLLTNMVSVSIPPPTVRKKERAGMSNHFHLSPLLFSCSCLSLHMVFLVFWTSFLVGRLVDSIPASWRCPERSWTRVSSVCW